MTDLSFDLAGWLTSDYGEDEARATMGSLQIAVGEDLRIPVTEIEDTIAQTVRTHIHVPLVSLANWLLMNWWRLRWEGRPAAPTKDWRMVHCMSGIGGDHVWPALEVYSDGQFIQLYMDAEDRPDVSAVRYLRRVALEVPVDRFEAAVERLLDLVEARLAAVLPRYRVVSELRAELAEERRLPSVARMCRWQALAGIDPGDAPEDWLRAAQALVEEAGAGAGDEIMSVLPELGNSPGAAADVIETMKRSSTAVDLSWASPVSTRADRELPWQVGVRLAREARKRHHLGAGPLRNSNLSSMLSVPVPLVGQPANGAPLGGGFRNGVTNGRTKITWPSSRPENQRFFLARMIGAAHVLPADEHVLPVTNKNSALQKIQRSFAQEFLCPWAALDAFTDERGVDDDSLCEAADYFEVSEWTIRSTLVNRGKISRDRLPTAG